MAQDKRIKSGLSQAVRDNLALGEAKRPWGELALEYKVKLSSVYRRVAEQRVRDRNAKQEAALANFGHVRTETRLSGQNSTKSFQALLDEAASSATMSRDERLKVLSVLAKTAPDAVKVQAVAKLEEFERAAGQQFGPPPPSDPEEVVNYLVELFDGLDPKLIQEAINRVTSQIKPKEPEITQTGDPNPGLSDLGGRAV